MSIMNRLEALSILELPENATDLQIKKVLEEKISYYEGLSKNSPSAFIRRLNAQQHSKLLLLKKDILSLLQPINSLPEVEVEDEKEQEESKELIEDDISSLTIPVIFSTADKNREPKRNVKEPVAFLIRHTENQSIKPFPLYAGRNYIGRKMNEELKPFLILADDDFVSRVHTVIYIEDKAPIECFIEDSAASNGGKASKNGTYLNGDEERITGKERLMENDTIQVGETKLILKFNNAQIDKIVEEVEDRDYMNTVFIKI